MARLNVTSEFQEDCRAVFSTLLFRRRHMLYIEGMLAAEDRTLRKIARSTVNHALRSVETKTARLVDALIDELTSQAGNFGSVDRLLELVLAHPQLVPETTT